MTVCSEYPKCKRADGGCECLDRQKRQEERDKKDALLDMKPCPFCGKKVDLTDDDTLYPSGTGWKLFDNGGMMMRSYHSFRDVPKEQWCWDMHCPEPSGGCGAMVSGDSRVEAIEKWNRRV